MVASEHYPRGTVAFLFTDIAGSTRLWQQHRPAMERAYARHDAVVRAAVADQRGVVYKVIGDAVQAAFPTAEQAVAAALEIQLSLSLQGWADLGLPEPLRVRMALHAGAVDPSRDGDYRSPVLNRLGRLLGAGHGGQVLLSQTVVQLARDGLPEDVSLRDLGDHRLKDLLEPERVHQLLHPALAAEFPPLVTLERRPHNLPVQLTPVIGREREVGELVELLTRPEVRLVTLTGPGGTGKTRLSLQVAAELVDDVADGVWFVPLASLTDPALVPSVIGEVLGIREIGGTPLAELLGDGLREKQLLLVLDNFEQVLDAAPAVHRLLAAPGVTILVTSRAPLRLRGEREYPVAPLGLPRRKPPPTAEQVNQFAAVRLFIERAQSVRPDFGVTNENAPAIAEICHRLDGLPLAIELAAARVKLLPPQAMLARLEQRLPMLTGGARDLPARQQTLRAAIAWSYDLLLPDEQKLYRRLSVFAGGWVIAAAEAVAGSPRSGELGLDLFDGLARLVDHSLVRQEEGTEGEPRFTILETIREYGLDQLTASDEAEEAHERHAAYFLELAEAAAPELVGPRQGVWLERLETEHDNLRTALAWAFSRDKNELALSLGGALSEFWWVRGHLSEGRGWLERALAPAQEATSGARARAQNGTGRLAESQGDYAAARAFNEQALTSWIDLGDELGVARSLRELGSIAWMQEEFGPAADLLGDAMERFRDLGDQMGLATTLNQLGLLERERPDPDLSRASTLFAEASVLFETLGDRGGVAAAAANLGQVALACGDHRQAMARYEEALVIWRDLGHKARVGWALGMLGEEAQAQGDTGRAVKLLAEAMEILRQVGDKEGLSFVLAVLGAVAVSRGDVEQATEHLTEALALSRELHNSTNVAWSLLELGRVTGDRGDTRQALALVQEGLIVAREHGKHDLIAKGLEEIARLAEINDRPQEAAQLYGAAGARREAVGCVLPPREVGRLDHAVADLRAKLGGDAFTAAWANGRALPWEEAVAGALALADELSSAAEDG